MPPFQSYIDNAYWITPNSQLSFFLKNGASVLLYLYPIVIFDPTSEAGVKEMEAPNFSVSEKPSAKKTAAKKKTPAKKPELPGKMIIKKA